MKQSREKTNVPLSESHAVRLLTRWFNRAGYKIDNNVSVSFGTVALNLDGWDERNLVGFEYLSSEHNDHADLTLEEYQHLIEAHNNQKYHILVIDEAEALSPEELEHHASEFLGSLAEAPTKKDTVRSLRKKVKELEAHIRHLERQAHTPENFPGYQPNRELDIPSLPQRPAVVCDLVRHSC